MNLSNFIACDDIRQEVSGKHTFVGVFENLTLNFSDVESWPAAIKISFYMSITREKGDAVFNRFEFKILRSGEEKASINGVLNFDEGKDIFGIVLNFNSMLIGSPGVLDFKFNIFQDERLIESFSPRSLTISSSVLKSN
jgi:hypothetical protein